MAAVAVAVTGGGALSSYQTTVLLTGDETMDALHKAQQVGYRAPGAWQLTRHVPLPRLSGDLASARARRSGLRTAKFRPLNRKVSELRA
jgi:hypothetical protein